MASVYTVLRSGGDYTAEYVQRLESSLREHLPGVPFVCLSDVQTVPGYCPPAWRLH